MAEIAADSLPALIEPAEMRDASTEPSAATAPVSPHQSYRRTDLIKHCFDRVLAFTALVLLLPLLAVIALAVRLNSTGPAFYSQERVGRDGRLFRIWKFRTMVFNADAELQNLLAQHGRDGAPLFKVPQDPRITRLGRVLRKYSIDELPQLFNVLLGHMSIVGPRPQRPAEVALYTDYERGRLAVKPGLTGLWQVNGRSDLPWADAVQYDLAYVRDRSLPGDLKIMAKTTLIVVLAEGAR